MTSTILEPAASTSQYLGQQRVWINTRKKNSGLDRSHGGPRICIINKSVMTGRYSHRPLERNSATKYSSMGPHEPPSPQKKINKKAGGAILEQMTIISIINNAVWITAASRCVLMWKKVGVAPRSRPSAACRRLWAPGGPLWPSNRTLRAVCDLSRERESLAASVRRGCRVTSLLNAL